MRVRGVAAVCLGGLLVACSGPAGPSTPGTTTPPTVARSQARPPSSVGAGSATVRLVVVPVCGPSSPQPTGCDPRPLAGVQVSVSDRGGRTVARGTTDEQGESRFRLAPGQYLVRGADVPAAAHPAPAAVTVTGQRPVTVTIRYESNLQ